MTPKLAFYPHVFVLEFFGVAVLLLLGLSLLQPFLDLDPVHQSATIESIDYNGEVTYIYFQNSYKYLIIHNVTRELCNEAKLETLETNDYINFYHNNTKLGADYLDYLLGGINPISLHHPEYGHILTTKDYLEHVRSPFMVITFILFGIPSLLIALALILSWFIAALMWRNPRKYENLEHHFLIQHKVVRDIP